MTSVHLAVNFSCVTTATLSVASAGPETAARFVYSVSMEFTTITNYIFVLVTIYGVEI